MKLSTVPIGIKVLVKKLTTNKHETNYLHGAGINAGTEIEVLRSSAGYMTIRIDDNESRLCIDSYIAANINVEIINENRS